MIQSTGRRAHHSVGRFTSDHVRAGEDALTERLLIATGNAGKLRELRSLLVGLPLQLLSLSDFPDAESVEETGQTFADNASLKASGYARQARVFTIADDSGLVVDALGGRPGVLSARYVRPDAPYPERIASLLRELESIRDPNRSARFVCAMAVATSAGEVIFSTQKSCEGNIAAAPLRQRWFRIRPIFVPDGFDQTFAELSAETKNRISHRGLALGAVREFLVSLTRLQSDR
jgi:XTP/dITP diphosphohydrolase